MARTFSGPPATTPRRSGPRTFEGLFLAQYHQVVRIAYKVLGDQQAAEDVAQEVFLSFNGKVDPAAEWAPGWLWAAAAHRALNSLRGSRRRSQRESRAERAPAPTNSAEEVALAAQDRQRVRDALASLPPRQAEVLVMRATGLAYAEIAMAIGIQPASVGTLLARAQRALRKELASD